MSLEDLSAHRCLGGVIQRGFTLIELIMVIVLLAVLAAFAVPRMASTSLFSTKGFHDETMALLRYAQKTAIAQRRTVCVTLSANGVTMTMDTNTPPDGACDSAPALPTTPRGGSGLTGSVPSFQFSPLGATNQSSAVTINILDDSSAITIEADTGYVHD